MPCWPAWFIPVVGNIIVPLAGVRFAPAEVSWFFFSIGLVFWIVLLAIVMYRLMAELGGLPVFRLLGGALVLITSIVIALLGGLTVRAVLRGEICRAE